MPGVKCKCKNIIKTGQIPNPNEWLLISDIDYDMYSGGIDAEDLYQNMKRMLVCNQCHRIWIYWEGNQNNPVSYYLEES